MSEGLALHEIITDEKGKAIDYRLLEVNHAFEQITGISRELAINALASTLYGTGNAPYLDIYGKVAETGNPVEFETTFDPLGKCFYISVFSPANGLFATLFQDITKRKQAEESLRNSEEKYRAIGESIDYGVWVCDLEGRNIYASPSYLKLVGMTQEQCSNFGWGDVLHPDDAENTIAAWKECSRTGDLWDVEHRFLGVDGQWHPVLARGVPVRDNAGNIKFWVGINLDISKLKLAEEGLRDSQQRLALAADAGLIGMYDLDMITGDLQWTPQQEIIFGYEPTTTTTTTTHAYQDWADRVYHEDLFKVEKSMYIAKENRVPFQTEYRLVWPDGSMHWVHVASKYYYDDSGRCTRLMGATRDITKRKQLEESLRLANEELSERITSRTEELQNSEANLEMRNVELETTNRILMLETEGHLGALEEICKKDQQLIQQSRLAAMGEMINNIAHQWRQPLNRVGLNIQRLPLFYDTDKFNREFLDTSVKDIMKQLNHMSQTIDDFRNFFKPEKEKVDFRVNEAIQQAINLIDDSFKNCSIDVFTQLDNDSLIFGYPNEFSQVLLNILQNARDAILECKISNGVVSIASSIENGKLLVTISDNAGGIPDDIIDKIFEPYFSTKGIMGTGIGLNMSKNIIETNMGGRLTVRNTDEGAEFRIEV